MTRERTVNTVFALLIVAVVGVLLWRAMSQATPAQAPMIFQAAMSYDEALRRSEVTDKPVMLVATADWCGPCQSYKRGPLASERVRLLVEERYVPVLLDLTDANPLGESLGIDAIPATLIIKEGKVIDRRAGVVPEDALVAWLKLASEAARPSGSLPPPVDETTEE